MTSRYLLRGAGWSLFGLLIPALAAVICIPILLSSLGPSLFGLLSLLLLLLGYFAILDLGLGRATTVLVAEACEVGDEARTSALVLTSVFLLSGIGVVSGIVLWCSAPWFTLLVSDLSPQLEALAVSCARALAVCVPVITISAALRGVLEAHGRFAIVNLIRGPVAAWAFIGPAVVVSFGGGLYEACLAIVGGRFLSAIALVVAVVKCRAVQSLGVCTRADLRRLVSVSYSIAVSNAVGALIIHLDRIAVSKLSGLAPLGYYTTASEVASKPLILPGALVSVLVPEFARGEVARRDGSAARYRDAFSSLLAVLSAVAAVGIVATDALLTAWVGGDVALVAAPPLQILLVGMVANGVAHVPLALLQSRGDAEFVARLHVTELVCYFPIVLLATAEFGIVGAAAASAFRSVVDLVILSRRAVSSSPKFTGLRRGAMPWVGYGVALLLIAALPAVFAYCVALAVVVSAALVLRRVYLASGAKGSAP